MALPMSTKVAKYKLEDAVEIVRFLQKPVKGFGYHVCLGGGVLNNGSSDKDIDLFFLPLLGDGFKQKPHGLIAYLSDVCHAKPLSIGYADQLPCIWKAKFIVQPTGYRIDTFVFGDKFVTGLPKPEKEPKAYGSGTQKLKPGTAFEIPLDYKPNEAQKKFLETDPPVGWDPSQPVYSYDIETPVKPKISSVSSPSSPDHFVINEKYWKDAASAKGLTYKGKQFVINKQVVDQYEKMMKEAYGSKYAYIKFDTENSSSSPIPPPTQKETIDLGPANIIHHKKKL